MVWRREGLEGGGRWEHTERTVTVETSIDGRRWVVGGHRRGSCWSRRFDVVVRYDVVLGALNRARLRFVALLTVTVELRVD